jgi:hypothetical protein
MKDLDSALTFMLMFGMFAVIVYLVVNGGIV